MNVGDPLPTLRGEFLTGRTVVLPQAAAGRCRAAAAGLQLRLRSCSTRAAELPGAMPEVPMSRRTKPLSSEVLRLVTGN